VQDDCDCGSFFLQTLHTYLRFEILSSFWHHLPSLGPVDGNQSSFSDTGRGTCNFGETTRARFNITSPVSRLGTPSQNLVLIP